MNTMISNCATIDDEETISDSFICCVCLVVSSNPELSTPDLLYKPIVLECGHVSCFWCVHKSMDGLRESHCPICRNPYHHFPTICETLYFLLLKMYPLAYKRKEKQIIEEEKGIGFFSPQLGGKELDHFDGSETSQDAKKDNDSAAIKGNDKEVVEYDKTRDVVSVKDVLCPTPTCKQLLFRPAVLNCGHVYCQACIIVPKDGVIICTICESPHPNEVPNVCLEFNNFLEEKFAEEYAVRRANIEHKQLQFRDKNPSSGSSSKKSAKKDAFKSFLVGEDFLPWWNEHGSKVHIGAGCDYCGMYPIVGNRYRCQDCVELIGFDLCGDCYNTSSKRPGRFNQQHTPDHRLALVKQPNFFRNIMLRLMGGRLIETHNPRATPLVVTGGIDNSRDGSVVIESQTDAHRLILDDDDEGGDSIHVDNIANDGSILMEFNSAPGVEHGEVD